MHKQESFLAKVIYRKYLSVIDGVKFTPREIDVIACVIHGKNVKSIAKFLSTDEKILGPRAVDTHILNIRRKIRGNSKETILDFIEKSHKYIAMRKYYLSILVQKELNKTLGKISEVISPQNYSFLIISWKETDADEDLINILRHCIETIGCNVAVETLEDAPSLPAIPTDPVKQYVIYALPAKIAAPTKLDYVKELINIAKSNSADFLFLRMQEDNYREPGDLKDFKYINITEEHKPYFLFFAILKNFFPGLIAMQDIEKDFLSRYETIEEYPTEIKVETGSNVAPAALNNNLVKSGPPARKFPSGRIYYGIVAMLILTSITVFILSRYLFRESDYHQTSYDKIEGNINELVANINSYKDISENKADGPYILSLQKAVDDLYNKYPHSLNTPELQSKFNYLSCVLADYYRYNGKYRASEPDAYLQAQYPTFKWFKNFDREKFYDHVAVEILERVLKHYNNKYGINDNTATAEIEAKTAGFDYVLQDYILLHHRLILGYMSLNEKDRSADYISRILEKYLSITALGVKYNMLEGYTAEKNRLIIRRDKVIKTLLQVERKLKQTFPIIKNETALISVVTKINLARDNKPLINKIIDDDLHAAKIEIAELGEIKNGFIILKDDNRQYIKFYAPWRKNGTESGRELFVPKNSFANMLELCAEILHTETVLMNYNILAYHDNEEKLRRLQNICLENHLKELRQLLTSRKIPDKSDYAELQTARIALAKQVKSLAEHYHDEEIAAELKKIAAMIYDDKFDRNLKNTVNLLYLRKH